MPGGWISCNDVIDKYHVSVSEIAKACYDGDLQAYTKDFNKKIYEETKVGKVEPAVVPKYQNDNYKRSDEIYYGVKWKRKLDINEHSLAITTYYDVIHPEKKILISRFINGELTTNSEFPVLFPFIFKDYKDKYYFMLKELNSTEYKSVDDLKDDYIKEIKNMVFQQGEVEAWLRRVNDESASSSYGEQAVPVPATEVSPMEAGQKRYAISASNAAQLLGVTARTIKRWETGERSRPIDYPGRYNLTAFHMFAAGYKAMKKEKKITREMLRPVSGGGVADRICDQDMTIE
ncbi:MAG: hypothetical protein LBR31_07900 [Desulfovibrio sp.]|jgi:DNA-binding transcriptional regulator YiaG|nr:hypothetical protein [Desulfovibrio sp.]